MTTATTTLRRAWHRPRGNAPGGETLADGPPNVALLCSLRLLTNVLCASARLLRLLAAAAVCALQHTYTCVASTDILPNSYPARETMFHAATSHSVFLMLRGRTYVAVCPAECVEREKVIALVSKAAVWK